MSLVDDICKLIDGCTEAEQRAIFYHLRKRLVLHPLESEWDINAETILSAIRRSSDLTLRGIRGIIAEATFEDVVVPQLASDWEAQLIEGDQSYDFPLLRRRDRFAVRIQVELQRKEKQAPKVISMALRKRLVNPPDVLYVVEVVQRTRTGKRSLKNAADETLDETRVEETRPYRYGEFDILAVSMHPSTRDWKRFMYTVSDWLLPRPDAGLVQIVQPVAAVRDSYWTDNLFECIDWFLSHQQRRLYGYPGRERPERPDEVSEQVSIVQSSPASTRSTSFRSSSRLTNRVGPAITYPGCICFAPENATMRTARLSYRPKRRCWHGLPSSRSAVHSVRGGCHNRFVFVSRGLDLVGQQSGGTAVLLQE